MGQSRHESFCESVIEELTNALAVQKELIQLLKDEIAILKEPACPPNFESTWVYLRDWDILLDEGFSNG